MRVIVIAAFLAATSTTTAFQLPLSTRSPAPRAQPLAASRNDDNGMERRELLQSAATALSAMGALGSLLAAFPGAAGAASPVINELKIRESVKGVKDSVEALKLYEDFVATKDFYGIKKSLRVPPVSEIRRDCRRIIAGLDGPIKKDTDKAYNQFIENLEQVDFLATKAIQNDNKAEDKELAQMTAKFADAQVKLGKVLELILTTRYATEPVNVRLETASTEL